MSMGNRSTTLPGRAVHADHGVGLTETRRKVFDLVVKAGQPVGAYRLLEAMQDKGTRVMPPTVYRALNFLQGKGLVHRIESLNAFVACTRHEDEHEGQFLICSDCGKTEELADESVSEMLRERATSHGFTLTQQTIELRGLCKDCAS
jgi:Fur family transcriptional regulator, zinc uptake regulator